MPSMPSLSYPVKRLRQSYILGTITTSLWGSEGLKFPSFRRVGHELFFSAFLIPHGLCAAFQNVKRLRIRALAMRLRTKLSNLANYRGKLLRKDSNTGKSSWKSRILHFWELRLFIKLKIMHSKKEKKVITEVKGPQASRQWVHDLESASRVKRVKKSTSMRICILWQLLPKFFLPRFPESLVRTKGCRVVAATAKALDSTENCWTSPNVARFAPWQTGSTNQVHGLLFDSQYQLFLACVKSYKAPTTSTAVRSLAPHDVFSNQFMKLSFLCDNLTSWLQPGDWKLESCKNATSNARVSPEISEIHRSSEIFFRKPKNTQNRGLQDLA